MHGPLDEVDGARVGGGAHPVHDGEAEDTSTQDVADHPVEILISQVVLQYKKCDLTLLVHANKTLLLVK